MSKKKLYRKLPIYHIGFFYNSVDDCTQEMMGRKGRSEISGFKNDGRHKMDI